MSRATHLRIAGKHATALQAHLFPGDGKEAVAFALCGRHRGASNDVLLVQHVVPVPYSDCPVRSAGRVTWKTHALEPVLARAEKEKLGVVKFHSHPTGYSQFSEVDDVSDSDLFPSIYGWIDDEGPHASVVMLPGGKLFGRAVDVDNRFTDLERITVAGHDVSIWTPGTTAAIPAHAERHAQMFGEATTRMLGSLKVGVVGCSGTGSFVIEMLARLGVRELVLVDPDRVEHRNLNRIVGATAADAVAKRLKVDALGASVVGMGLGTAVERIAKSLATREAVMALAACDIVVGCMDSHDGRRTLNRLASFYLLPYFDCGVGLTADGNGGIEGVAARSSYLQPGGSSLVARGIVKNSRADEEALRERDARTYEERKQQKYIQGADESRPAVISVNSLAASLLVNEMIARLHPYRSDPNNRHANVRMSLSDMHLDIEAESGEGELKRSLGRGDVRPLLDMSELSDGQGR